MRRRCGNGLASGGPVPQLWQPIYCRGREVPTLRGASGPSFRGGSPLTAASAAQSWRQTASALLPALVLAALALYFAVAWQAHQQPLEVSPWNDRWAIGTAFSCAGIAFLLLAGQARLLAWLAAGSVLALLVAVGILGGAAVALPGLHLGRPAGAGGR